MKLNGKIDWTDYRNFLYLSRAATGLGKTVQYITYVLAAVVFLATTYLYSAGVLDFMVILLMILIVLVGLGSHYIIMPWWAKKIYQQQKDLSLPFEIEITTEELRASNELSTSRRPWKNFNKWKEDKDSLLLYHSDVMATIIPKRFLTDPAQLETIKKHLADNNVPADRGIRQLILNLVFFILVGIMLLLVFFLIGAVIRF